MARTLRTRREARGALVLLADGRLAVTGEGVVATGSPRQLVRYCRDRIAAGGHSRGARVVAGGRGRGAPKLRALGQQQGAPATVGQALALGQWGEGGRDLVGLVVEQAGEDQRPRRVRDQLGDAQQQRAHQVRGDDVGRWRRLARAGWRARTASSATPLSRAFPFVASTASGSESSASTGA